MKASSLRKRNYADLRTRFFARTPASKGFALVTDRKRGRALDGLLRSHLVKGVLTQREVTARDSVDHLLSYLGLLEIASIVSAIPWPLPGIFGRRAERALSNAAVRRYYEHFYPLILPVLFRWRLEGTPLVQYGAFDGCVPHFQQFLNLSEILGEPEVIEFLWFLDDGRSWDPKSRKWVGLRDFFGLLTHPAKLVKYLAHAGNQSPVADALRGFLRFVSFSLMLDQLLVSTSEWPLLQSALWHHHAYWFYQLSGQVGGVLAAGIEGFRAHVGDGSRRRPRQEAEAVTETHRLMDSAQLVLQRLTSSLYRAPLEQAYFARVLGEPLETSQVSREATGVTDVQPPLADTATVLQVEAEHVGMAREEPFGLRVRNLLDAVERGEFDLAREIARALEQFAPPLGGHVRLPKPQAGFDYNDRTGLPG